MMKIVIAGAGEVGVHLAKMLASQEQNIILIDTDTQRLERVARTLDVLSMVADSRLIADLKKAGVEGADLFIAVTPEQSTNITSCMLAKQVGATRTIARVNEPSYIEPEYTGFFANMGVDLMFYPEELAARDITATTLNPWARQYTELFNGALTLVAIKVRSGAPIVGKQLHELGSEAGHEEKFYHIVAIKRDLETIIPSGNTRVEADDLLFFTCATSKLAALRALTGKPNPVVRKMVIMGASRTALQTIDKLPKNIHIDLIEQDKKRCLDLAERLPSNVSIYHGDGREPEILEEIGLDDVQVFVALSENSETNILACLAAKRYGVYKTIAKEENIDYIQLAYRLDIGTLINKKLLAVGHIYRTLLGMQTGAVVSLSMVNNAEVAEFIVRRSSGIVGKKVKDLNLPANITLGGMVRSGVPKMIHGDTVIEAYDHIVIFYHNIPLNVLKTLFS